MTFANFKVLTRGYVPGAKAQIITDTVLGLILNNAVKDIAVYTCCLKTNKKFNAVASQQEYILSTVLGDYLTPDKSGLWWNQGTVSATNYKQLDARTLAWLDSNRPNWRDLSAGSPQEYTIDGDILTVVPKPTSALANAFWFYYGETPVIMSAEEHYPFTGSTTELTQLSVFDDAILSYARWKIEPILNKDQTVDITEQQYKRAREEAYTAFKRRRDININADTRFSVPTIR